MNKTKFNKLHKYNITINGNKYRLCHLKEDEYGPCDHCDCNRKSNNYEKCIGFCDCVVSCDDIIGRGVYLKLIHHVKNKV